MLEKLRGRRPGKKRLFFTRVIFRTTSIEVVRSLQVQLVLLPL